MSLRDQLLAKGLVSKKRAREIGREAKAERKEKQGKREKRRKVEAATAAQEAEENARALAERASKRQEARRQQEAHEHRHRVRRLVLDNRVVGRGRVAFHHRVGTTAAVARMQVSEEVATDLRAGRLAIAGFLRDDEGWEHHVVARRAAEKLDEIEPEAVVHWSRGQEHLGDPAEAVLSPTWEPSLRPHRVRSRDDVARFLDPT